MPFCHVFFVLSAVTNVEYHFYRYVTKHFKHGCFNQSECQYYSFDLLVDGHYLNWSDCTKICKDYGIEIVPVVGTIPYDLSEIKNYSDGKTWIMQEDAHIREGLVVRPLQKRTQPKIDLVILKTDYIDQ